MSTFQIPQFIEEKSKIIGPLTMRQFLYVVGAAGLSIVANYMFPFFLWVLITAIAAGVALSFAFIKINGQPLPSVLVAAILFWQRPKIYVWQRKDPTTTLDVSALERIEALRRHMSLQEKIRSVTLSITTGNIPFFKKKKGGEQKEKYQVVRYLTGERRIAKKVDYSQT